MKKTALFLIIFILVPFLLHMHCSRGKKIRIALMTKLESGSLIGSSEVNAAKLLLEKYNIQNIEVIPYDDGWQPEKALKAFEQIRRDGIDILITSHVSTCAVAIMDAVNRDRVLTLVAGATTDALSGKDDFILRNILDVEKEQKSIALYMRENNFRKILIVKDDDNSAYTDPALKYFTRYYGRGGTRVIRISISGLDTEKLEKEMRKRDFGSIYLLIGGYQSLAGSVAQLARKIRPGVPVMYTPWMKTPAIIDTAGKSILGSVMPSHYPPRKTDPAIDSYIVLYERRFGHPPTFISLNVYTALQLISFAVNAGKTGTDEIRDYLINSGPFKTDFSTVNFDSYGDINSRLYFITDIKREF